MKEYRALVLSTRRQHGKIYEQCFDIIMRSLEQKINNIKIEFVYLSEEEFRKNQYNEATIIEEK